jgi:hypothetical protein
MIEGRHEFTEFGIAIQWWTLWQKETLVKRALSESFNRHFDGAVDKAMKDNKGTSLPSTWTGVARALRQNRSNVHRSRGKKGTLPSIGLVLSYASVLDVGLFELMPTQEDWLALGTKLFIGERKSKNSGEIPVRYRSYARFMMEVSATGAVLADIDRFAERNTEFADAKEDLMDVASQVGRTLHYQCRGVAKSLSHARNKN